MSSKTTIYPGQTTYLSTMDIGRRVTQKMAHFSQIRLGTERLRVMDLSRRACGADAGF